MTRSSGQAWAPRRAGSASARSRTALRTPADPSARDWVSAFLAGKVEPLFVEWLREHYPDRADHVLSLLRQLRGGALYESGFGSRQRGFGPFAALLKARFEKARRRLRLEREVELSTDKFVPPRPSRRQLDLGF